MQEPVKCWEFFDCDEQECPVYKTQEVRCWLVSGTHCRNGLQGKFLEKIEMCLHCEPFKTNVDLASLEETLKAVSEQFTEEIGERRRAEKALQKAHHELEIRFEERTEELTRANALLQEDISERKRLEAQLQQAQKLEAIGTLAGGIAHDFNNLLMGIQGNVSLLMMDISEDHAHHGRLKSIENQVQSGARLTSQLLGYARKGRYEVRTLDLNGLVNEISDTFGRTKKDITIRRELAEDLFAVEADPGQTEQVLLNLFVNAADAMPNGGELALKTMNTTHREMQGKLYRPKPGDYVLLQVTDTGMGMDKTTTERIFDPFFTTKERGRGTGLGLASAYGIIKGHDGYVDVDSARGRGTTFSVYLPASPKTASEGLKSSGHVSKGNETVLLVDDEKTIREVGGELLEAMGYQVLLAEDGKKALETYEENQDKIDLVLLDMVMPNMGGGEAYDRLREIDPDVKVLLSSGFSIDGEATKILARGCDGFIQKPFTMKELSERIRQVVREG